MTDHHFTTTSDAFAAFDAQGAIPPGTPGFWRVWGAQVRNIRTGDLILTKDDAGEVHYDLILDTFEAKAAPMRRGFISDASPYPEGKFTLGALSAVIILRWDTHHMLAS